MGQFSCWAVFLGAICPRGNYVGDKSFEREFSLGAISRGILSGGNYLWGNCPVAIIQGQLSTGQFSSGAIILGGNCAGGNCPRGNYLGDNFPRGQLSGHQISHIFYCYRGTFPLALSEKFCIMTKFAEHQLLPMIEF